MDSENTDVHNRKLQDIFLDGWELYEFLNETTIDTNGVEFQRKVKLAMERFEIATTIVSQIGMFSSNESIDEVSTESLQYLMLPYFLGKLALQRNEQNRADALRIADVYFRDFLQRCKDFDIYEGPKPSDDKADKQNNLDSKQQLVASAITRNKKISQYKLKKELEEQVKKMRNSVKNNAVDDEIKRDFFMKFIKKSIIDASEELENVKLEKNMVEMRNQHIAKFGITRMDDFMMPPDNALNSNSDAGHFHGNVHGHSHSHWHPHRRELPKPKPMQPFIITKDATQKAVFGLGYPSLPVMTVDEFYQQRVDEGIFPDEEKMARINKEKALAAAQDPDIKEEEEKAALEQQIENDDPEYIDRMRRMDEYKDVVRRGDGNRYNRS